MIFANICLNKFEFAKQGKLTKNIRLNNFFKIKILDDSIQNICLFVSYLFLNIYMPQINLCKNHIIMSNCI